MFIANTFYLLVNAFSNEVFYVYGVAAIAVALILMILLYAFILPRKSRNNLPGFFRGIHDFFRPKRLWIEGLSRFFYVLEVVLSVCFGLCLIVISCVSGFEAINLICGILFGLLSIFLLPILFRLIFEAITIFITLTQQSIDMNGNIDKLVALQEALLEETKKANAAKAIAAGEKAEKAIDATPQKPVVPANPVAPAVEVPVAPAVSLTDAFENKNLKPIPAIDPVPAELYPREKPGEGGPALAEHAEDLAAEKEKAEEAKEEAKEDVKEEVKEVEANGPRKCPSCGAEVEEGSSFCVICGTKLI